jgi:hypothetical protein
MSSSSWKLIFFEFGFDTEWPVPGRPPLAIIVHQVHNACKTRLRQPLYCPHCERIVDRKEVDQRNTQRRRYIRSC